VPVFISGSVAYDRIMDFPGKFSDHILPEKIHVLNVCFNVNGVKEHFGGTAGNIAYGLALLGERPVVMAACGRDFEPYRRWLEQHRISCRYIRMVEDELTAGAYITTDLADNQITGFNPGAMKYPTYHDFDGTATGGGMGIIAAGNLEDMIGYARIFRERGIPYIFDPGQSLNIWSPDSLLEALTGSRIFISNDYELELTLKHTGISKALLLERTEIVITTKGELGSIVTTRNEEIHIPAAVPERVVDPTGAGDAFRSGLIKGLVTSRDIVTSARMGAVAASFAVERYGTQEYRFEELEFRSRFERNFGPLE
jgi:adenosine kinase